MVPAELVDVFLPMATLILMGRMGAEALYVRSLFTPLAFLFLALHTGLGVTTQVAAAVARGQGRLDQVAGRVTSIVRVGLPAALVLAGVLAVLAPTLAHLLSAQPSARDDFVEFVRWTGLAYVCVLGPTVCVSALRGGGRPWAAGAVIAGVATIQIGLTAIGVAVHAGILVVPAAIAAANVAGTVAGVVLLRRFGAWPPGTSLAWRPAVVGSLLSIGAPVAGSLLILFVSNLGLTWVVSAFGPDVVTGFATAATVQSVVVVPAIALGSATAILMNEHRGAGRGDRLPGVLDAGLRISAIFYLVTTTLVVFATAHGPTMRAVTGNAAAASEARHYLAVVGPTYLCMGLALVALTIMEQLGAGALAVTLNGTYVLVTLGGGGWLARHAHHPDPLYLVVAVANVLAVGVLPIVTRKLAR
ncbi:MATE family efflux transporter [Actinoplanes sp. TBRC 11911]|uniref:MATE family efflux transporter n=1 Tax=Actinoplanes sp. TBRC 11911 TaxID=2729386 RepID=UPI0028977D54|nr:MATE family efflux transporter [Actinoplanes sp. TBRC 11911]